MKSSKRIAGLLISIAFLTSSCSSPFYDQSLNEAQSLRNCYAGIRDGIIDSIKDCGEYVTFHAPLYSEIDQSSAAVAACSFSVHLLNNVRTYYQRNQHLVSRMNRQVINDCKDVRKTDHSLDAP